MERNDLWFAFWNAAININTYSEQSLLYFGSDLIENYLAIDDALFNNDATAAAQYASQLFNIVNNLDLTPVSKNQSITFFVLQVSVAMDAMYIQNSLRLNCQKLIFVSLAHNLVQLTRLCGYSWVIPSIRTSIN